MAGRSAGRRAVLGALAAAPFGVPALARAADFPTASYDSALVIDGQGALADPYAKEGSEDPRLSPRAAAEVRASGLTAVSVTVGDVGNAPDVWQGTINRLAANNIQIRANRDLMLLVDSAADIRRAKAERRVGVIYNLQDTSAIGADLDRTEVLKGLGVRVVQLTYNRRNLSGDGCLEAANGGLSTLGRDTIARIEKEKLLLDLSHAGQRTTAEAIAAAKRPPTISHTGCRAVHDNPRNHWDAELRACAEKGGVVGIYWMPFLAANSQATGADLVRHMTHAVNVCGEDHVAIGTDNILGKTVIDARAREQARQVHVARSAAGIAAPGEGPDVFTIVAEWDDHMRFRHLADGLSKAGWPARRIEKVLGDNLMRLYTEVWDG